MSRLAKLSARFIGEGGFSIGITDVTPSASLMADKGALIGTAYEECDRLISDFKGGTLSLLPGCDEDQSLEVPALAAVYHALNAEQCDACQDLLIILAGQHRLVALSSPVGSAQKQKRRGVCSIWCKACSTR